MIKWQTVIRVKLLMVNCCIKEQKERMEKKPHEELFTRIFKTDNGLLPQQIMHCKSCLLCFPVSSPPTS